jgi:hypothetical protein
VRAAALLAALALAACGDGGAAKGGAEPVRWQVVFEAQPGALLRAWGPSADDVYVVGADTGDGSVVLHFDGERWRRLHPGTHGTLWWVQGVGPDDVRMVGDHGLALRYTPSTGRFEARPTGTDARLFGVWGASSDDVWYVGGDTTRGTGVVLRDDGRSIVAPDLPAPGTAGGAFFKVQGWAADAVWMVGQGGRALFWDGRAFQAPATGTSLPLMGVHGTSADDVLAVGGVAGGVLLAWDGAAWRDETPRGTPQMTGVWAQDATLAYAAGFNGHIYRRRDGEWADLRATTGTYQSFHAIWVDETGGLWAVGGRLAADPPTGGMLIHYGPPLSTEVTE